MTSNRNTRRKSGQQSNDLMNSKLTIKKSKADQSNVQYFAMEDPYDLSQRFKNMENALKFIENPRIKNLDRNYFDLKNELKKQQQSKAEFSKAIYKKVISRDNDFNFQHKIDSQDYDITDDFNQRHTQSGGQRKKAEKMHGDTLGRRFKHGDVSDQAKKERLRQQSEIPLLFKHVKAIQTPQFDRYRDVQFYELIKGEGQQKQFEHNNGGELQTLSIQNEVSNFKHNLITESQYHNKQSYKFIFNCDRELTFWRLENIFKQDHKNEQHVLSNCAFFDSSNITSFQVFDFGSRNIQINDIIMLYELKEQLQLKIDMDKNNDSLEEKFNQAKKRFQQMKQLRLKSKNQRLPAKFVNSVAQTNDQMQERDFDDYFVLDAKNIFDRLEQLNEIRDRIVDDEDGETFKVMVTNIGVEIGKQLFKLLMLVLKGEKELSYSNFVRAQNEQEVEKKILELIYLQFKNFTEYEVGGVSKIQIIKKYLEYRQKNERFYQSFVFKSMAEASKKKRDNSGFKKAKKVITK